MPSIIDSQKRVLVFFLQEIVYSLPQSLVRFQARNPVVLNVEMIPILEHSSKRVNLLMYFQVVGLPRQKQNVDLGVTNTVPLRPCSLDGFIQISSELFDIPDMAVAE
jgi:hypothetical protein